MNTLNQIKMRCWSIQERRFVENFVIMDGGLWLINDESEMNLANPDDYIISRFTGETYMGRDIYEGDIINYRNPILGEIREQFVKFHNSRFNLVNTNTPLSTVGIFMSIADFIISANRNRFHVNLLPETMYERGIRIN